MDSYPENKTRRLIIRTPEGIVFSHHIATPVSRWLAWIMDIAIIIFLTALVNQLSKFFQIFGKDISHAIWIVSYFLLTIGYGIFCEWKFSGQTIGKRVLGLRVIDVEGMRLQFSQIIIRNLIRCIDIYPLFYAVGGISCLISRNGQRLGDIAGRTIVIHHVRIPTPDLKQLGSVKYNSLRRYPHLAAQLRQRISPEEAGLALDAIIRREVLNPIDRVRLFETLANHFKKIVPFPPEASEGVPDEQHVRNVLDILFKSLS